MTTEPAASQEITFGRETLVRLRRAIVNFGTSEVGGRAGAYAGLLAAFLLAINALNVINSYVGRDFMTAIERRDWPAFVRDALLYLGVFALLTLAAVFYRFTEERLGLLWREWITRRIVTRYLENRLYHRLQASGTLTNPDQRIADDVRAFTTMTLSLTLIFLNGALTILAFSGVLWSISRLLFVVAVLYAGVGSLLAVYLGRPLVRLNYDQADREANFRADLVHIRENTESVALLHHEAHLRGRLLARVDAFTSNLRRIIAVNRNLSFFTTGYNYLIQLIPALLVAPLFIRGSAEFGVIAQSSMAFANVVGAFSLVVNQFPSLSSYAAVLVRLTPIAGLGEPVEAGGGGGMTIVEDERRLVFEGVTLRSPHDGQVLVRALTVEVLPRMRLLVTAAADLVTNALQRAIIGIWDAGEGRILRPRLEDVLVLPDRPYLPPGRLRELLGAVEERGASDELLWQALRTVGADGVVQRIGGLDVERDWDDLLSLEEQRLLGLARLLVVSPRFAVIAHLGVGLGSGGAVRVLDALAERGTGCVALGNDVVRPEDFDTVIAIAADGTWRQSAGRARSGPGPGGSMPNSSRS
jgi:putative ATP-binding cassette transporter